MGDRRYLTKISRKHENWKVLTTVTVNISENVMKLLLHVISLRYTQDGREAALKRALGIEAGGWGRLVCKFVGVWGTVRVALKVSLRRWKTSTDISGNKPNF